MSIEKLTDEGRAWLEESSAAQGLGPGACASALRIIDQLTAALEAAQASHLCPCGERETRLLAAESRAEALQARVAELEAERDEALSDANEYHAALLPESTARAKAEAELATAKARVAELEAESARLRSSEAQYRERVSVEESKRYQSEKLLRKTAQRLESLHQAADAVCRVRERAPDATLHDIRVSVSTLRDVLSRPNLVSPLATAAEAELADLRGRVERALEVLDSPGSGMSRVSDAATFLRGGTPRGR